MSVLFLCLLFLWDLATVPAAGAAGDDARAPLAATVDLSGLALEAVLSGLDDPISITHAGDSRLFLTLQAGRVVIVDGDVLRSTPFLDIRPRVRSGGERGLFSLAFHPDFPQTPFFFVNYTDLGGDTVVARYRVNPQNPDLASPESAVTLLGIDQPFGNHNGGQLQFGPDGNLYIGMGDGGSANDPFCNGQRTDTLLGKMLRIDVDQSPDQPPYFGIPADNPSLGPAGPPEEVWASGLRNPWRFSFDRVTGDLFIADVGQGDREEINFQPTTSPGGENYGWKVLEGNLCLGSTAGCPTAVPACASPAYTPPILEYDHSRGDCAVIGGYVYRGHRLPQIEGVYFYGDFCTGRLLAAWSHDGAWTSQELDLSLPGLTSFGEDAQGELYLTAGDALYRLTGPAPQNPGRLELTQATLAADEDQGTLPVVVRRVGGSDGTVSVEYETRNASATAGEDYVAAAGTLRWESGEVADKTFTVELLDDSVPEPDETLELRLGQPTGGARLGTPHTAEITIVDNDPAVTVPCSPTPTTLCLRGERFQVEIDWHDGTGGGPGQAQPLSADSGYFWFFSPTNLEVLVKVIDACLPPFQRFWIFAAGLTDVQVDLRVTDTRTGQIQSYQNPLQQPFLPIQDTRSFATCP